MADTNANNGGVVNGEEKKPYTYPMKYKTDDGLVFVESVFPKSVFTELKQMDEDGVYNDGDVLIATYMRSGTTWACEILWQLFNDVNVEKSKETPLSQRVPFAEWSLPDPENPGKRKEHGPEEVRNMKSPRLIKTHLPLDYFQKSFDAGKLKVVFVIRDIKDVLVSCMHFHEKVPILGPFTGTWDEYFELWKNDELLYGNWLDSIKSYIKARNHPNVILVTYEELKEDTYKHVKRIADHCGIDISHEKLVKLCDHVDIKNMQKNSAVQHKVATSNFIRKGAVGEWAQHFTEEQLRFINDKIEKELKVMWPECPYEPVVL